jgi:hypothetical protein
MKIDRDRLLWRVDYWASGAIYFGAGYWFLSMLKSGTATLIAVMIISVGGVIRLSLHRWRRSRQ